MRRRQKGPLLCENPLPVIPIVAFSKKGLFDIASWRVETFALEVPGLCCEATYHANKQKLLLNCTVGDATFEFAVRIVFVTRRPYFICDCCNARRIHLVVSDRKGCCSEHYRNEGDPSLSRSLRNARVVIALEDLRRLRPVARPGYLTEPPVIKTDKKPAPKEPKPPHRLSTERALQLGRGAAQYAIVQSPSMRKKLREVDAAKEYRWPDRVEQILKVPELNLNRLAPALLNEGHVRAQTLCWGDRPYSFEEILFIGDWLGVEPQLLAIWDYADPNVARVQHLPLVRQVNGRFRFRCPVLGEKFDTLYLRDELFASRLAHRLVHPSQRAAGRKRDKDSQRRAKKHEN